MPNMSQETAITVKNIKKDFLLPKDKSNSIKQKITQVFNKPQKGYNIHHAIHDVSFDIKKGEFFGILGRNGSGKSTLLKIIAEIYKPSSGSVDVKGKLVPFIELGVGFNPELSGRENVYLNGALLGFSNKEMDERYEKIVEFAELERFMSQQLKNYSSGMKVRLAFSVAIQADADILLLDEVLAVGDAAFQRKCYDYFRSLKDQKKTIVFVSHNMNAVRDYCDRAILIENGRIAYEGDPSEVTSEYLRLFVKPSESDDRSAQAIGDISIQDVKTELKQEELLIDISLKNDIRKINNVTIGVDFYDSKNKLVGGFDSSQCGAGGVFNLLPNEKKVLRFKTTNIFGGGSFNIAASIKIQGTDDVIGLLKNATTFTNVYELNENLPVILPVKLIKD